MSVAEESKIDRLMQWHRGETPGPWMISFYPTYRCNIRCKICWKQAFEEPIDRDQEVTKSRMLELVDEAAEMGVRYWILGGGGELMLRSNAVIPMVEKIREHGMNGLIQTNFTRWTDENLARLVDIGWERVNVSLDGPTPEINDTIRDKNDFQRVVDSISRIEEIKHQRGCTLPAIQITSVVTNLNYDKLRGFIDLSQRLGTNGGLFLVDLIQYGENDKQFELTSVQRAEMPALVRDAIQYAEEKNVPCLYHAYLHAVESGEKVDAMALFHEPEEFLSHRSMCYEPFYHMVILPEGTSGPCCTFYDPERADTIWNRPLKEVWMGPYMQESRQRLLQGKPMDYCKDCMITRVAINRDTQGELVERILLENYRKPVTAAALIAKAGRSLSKHGVSGSIRRGREWLELRALGRKVAIAQEANTAGK